MTAISAQEQIACYIWIQAVALADRLETCAAKALQWNLVVFET
jgi:hypothetical protein